MIPSLTSKTNLRIEVAGATLHGDLAHPKEARGMVLFAHGSGSGRKSPRNRFVAAFLQRNQISTLLFDLLTEEEEQIDARTAHVRFDVALLARRLIHTTEWVREREGNIPLGYFGASTGAAAGLLAAATLGHGISAVVSRGGRPDLAGAELLRVTAPTLLIVGSLDTQVIALNQAALAELHCVKKMEIIPGASHLFEETDTLEQVSRLAADWFKASLGTTAQN